MATHIVNFPDAHVQSTKITATTSVGIGTSGADAYPLTIFKETDPEIRIHEGATQSSAAKLYSNNSNLYIQTGTDFSSGSSGDIAFQTMGGQATHMVIKSDGKVGVGTDSPGNKLHIQGDSAVVTSDPSVNNYGQIEISSSSYAGWTNADRPTNLKIGIDHTVGTLGAGFIQGVVDYIQAGVPLLLCPGGGNVGIGTNSPQEKLHVYTDSASSASQLFIRNTNASNRAGLSLINSDNSYFNIQHVSGNSNVGIIENFSQTNSGIAFYAKGDGAYTFRTTDSNSLRMIIGNDGNVGIGTNNATRKLHVEGEIGLYGEKLLQAVIGYQRYTNTSGYQSTAASGGYFDCFNFNYNRKRSDSTIHIRAFLCPAQAFGDNGYRNTHRAVYVRLKFTENNSTVTYSHDVTDWERQDYGFHEYQRIVYIKHNNTFTGSTSGQNINIKAQVSSGGNNGTMGRWGINIWGGRSTVEVYETLY